MPSERAGFAATTTYCCEPVPRSARDGKDVCESPDPRRRYWVWASASGGMCSKARAAFLGEKSKPIISRSLLRCLSAAALRRPRRGGGAHSGIVDDATLQRRYIAARGEIERPHTRRTDAILLLKPSIADATPRGSRSDPGEVTRRRPSDFEPLLLDGLRPCQVRRCRWRREQRPRSQQRRLLAGGAEKRHGVIEVP